MAAVLACGDQAVLSHDSAAALWGIRTWPAAPEVTAPHDRRRPGIRAHRTETLTRSDIRRAPQHPRHQPLPHHPRPPVPPHRPPARPRRQRPAPGQAPARHRASPPPQPPPPASRRLIDPQQNPTRSPAEDAFLEFCRTYRLPTPKVNITLFGRERDAVFEAEKVIIEIDGYTFHNDHDSFESDRERDTDAAEHGYLTVRLTTTRLTQRPAYEAARLHRILRRTADARPRNVGVTPRQPARAVNANARTPEHHHTQNMFLLLLFALIAGAATAITPCVLPVLPALLSASAAGGRRRPLGIVLGLAITFTIAIVALAQLVKGVGLAAGAARTLAIIVLLIFGVVLLIPELAERVQAPLSPPGPLRAQDPRRRVLVGAGRRRRPGLCLRAVRRAHPGRGHLGIGLQRRDQQDRGRRARLRRRPELGDAPLRPGRTGDPRPRQAPHARPRGGANPRRGPARHRRGHAHQPRRPLRGGAGQGHQPAGVPGGPDALAGELQRGPEPAGLAQAGLAIR